MRKLSSKLLLALGVIITGVIVWQVLVSKRVINDTITIKQVQSIEQMHDLLKNRELKSYKAVPCHPFSTIRLNGVDTHILKGNQYAIYVNDYYKRYIEIVQNGDELLINYLDKENYTHDIPVFIFMPEDPQSVYYTFLNGIFSRNHKIYGFKGDNTLIFCEGFYFNVSTDMPYVNINQKDNNLNLHISGLDSTLRINNVQINVIAENSRFHLDDKISDSVNMNIQLQKSNISSLNVNPHAKVGTLSLKGTLRGKENNRDSKDMEIHYPGQCDSLIIQLAGDPGNARQLLLSKDLSGRFEDINCSENVVIIREE